MSYPQNGDRIEAVDSVTSLHPMYSLYLLRHRVTVIGNARGEGSTERSSVRPSVCLSVPSFVTLPAVAAAAPLLLSASMQQTLAGLRCCRLAAVRPAGRRYRLFAACRRSAAAAPHGVSSNCGQCHAGSRRRKLNTDLFQEQHKTTSRSL